MNYGTYKYKGLLLPVQDFTTGSVFFVDNTTGNDIPGNGGDPSKPFATIDYAIGKCTANKGDVIYPMPGHYESGSAADMFDADVAGISIIGLGRGTDMPQMDFLHANSECAIGADNVTIRNINFHSNIIDVLIGLDIEAGADNALIEDCLFDVETTATDQFLISINIGVVSGTIVRNCKIDMGLGGAATGVKLVGASTGCDIVDNIIKGDYSLGCIAGITTLSTEVLIKDNILFNGGSGNIGAVACVSMLTGTTGLVIANEVFCNVATVDVMMLADTMIFSRNYASEDISEAADSIVWGAAASVTPMADG